MSQEVHPSPTAGDGRVIEQSIFIKKADKRDNMIRCAQCGFILDLDKLPEMMRQNGVVGRDGIIYYGCSVAWAGRRGWSSLENPEIRAIYDQRERIFNVMESYMLNVERRFRANPGLQGVAVINDGRDKMGCDLAPTIKERLKEFGDRIQTGNFVPESEY